MHAPLTNDNYNNGKTMKEIHKLVIIVLCTTVMDAVEAKKLRIAFTSISVIRTMKWAQAGFGLNLKLMECHLLNKKCH